MKQTVRLKNEEMTVDESTGQIITHTKHYGIKVQKSDDFMMIYMEHLMPLFQIKQKRDMDVLFRLMSIAEYNSGRILMPSPIREEMQRILGMSKANFSTSLRHLEKANLISGTRGVYFLNPKVCWKGTSSQRQAFLDSGGALRFTIEFSKDGATSKDIEGLQPNENFDNELTDGDY